MKHDLSLIRAGAAALAHPFGDPRKRELIRPRFQLMDQFITYDQATYDSAGAFLIGELERLDPTIHEPLVSTSWSRDIDLRTDVQMGDEYSSWTVSTFGSVGGAAPAGISWAGKNTTTLPRATVDIGKKTGPLNLWAEEVAYTLPELASAQVTGRPIDSQMLTGLNLKHQMDIDQLVYLGDASIGTTGLLNNSLITNTGNVANGAAGTPTFVTKTPDEIVADFNELLVSVWAASGWKAPPNKVLMSPGAFGYLSTIKVSEAGNVSILKYVMENNIFTAQFKIDLDILPVKWLDKANINGPGGAAATYGRMVAYTQKQDYVRYPMVPLQATAPQYRGIWIAVPYYGRLGQVEVVYPETIGIRDGID